MVKLAKMEKVLTKGLNTLSDIVFEIELTRFFECLHCLSQLFVVMEVLVIVFGSIDTMHRTIVGLSKLLQPFLRVEIRDGFHDYCTVGR